MHRLIRHQVFKCKVVTANLQNNLFQAVINSKHLMTNYYLIYEFIKKCKIKITICLYILQDINTQTIFSHSTLLKQY